MKKGNSDNLDYFTYKTNIKVDNGVRSPLLAIILQILIRIRYMFESWFLIKPFVTRLSGYDHDNVNIRDRPIMPFWCELGFKLLWCISGFVRQYRPLTFLLLITGIFRLLSWIHNQLTQYTINQFEKSGYNWSKVKDMPIPEFDWENRDPKEFYELYVCKAHPCILRNFMNKNSELLTNLTFDNLVHTYGDERVYLTKNDQDGIFGELNEVNNKNVYLRNSEKLFQKFPKILSFLQLSKLESFAGKMRAGFTQLFIGKNGTGSPFHSAASYNFFYMADGVKKWYFIHPLDTALCYPMFGFGRNAAFSLILYPDLYEEKTFKLFKYCPYYSAQLNPGDVLFNPPWWWHAIKNQSEKSVGIASRWHTQGIMGSNLTSFEENYDIARYPSWCFYAGIRDSMSFLHKHLQTMIPKFDEHITLREKNNNYAGMQKEGAFEPGFAKFGYRFIF